MTTAKTKAAASGGTLAGFQAIPKLSSERILPQPQMLPTTRRRFFCAYHPSVPAVALMAAHEIETSTNTFRALCQPCLERVRVIFGLLRAEADERREAA